MTQTDSKQGDIVQPPAIIRGRLDCLRIYDVTEQELSQLREGSPASIQLNFAIFLLSVAVTLITVLATTPPVSLPMRVTFVALAAVGLANGLLLLCVWWRRRRSVHDLVETIKKRLPAEGIQELPASTTIAIVNQPTFRGEPPPAEPSEHDTQATH